MKSTVNKTHALLFYFAAIFYVSPLYAEQTIETTIIEKVLAAYGGQALTEASSIKLIDYNKGPWPGESENPGLPEIWRINEELTIDFKRGRKSLLSYRVPRTTLDLEKWIFDGEKTIKYDIFHKKYNYLDWVTYQWLGGSIVRSSDTMQAKRLHSDLKKAVYLGDEFFRGRPQQKLAVTLQSGAQFIYFVDSESGLIRKILREHPRAGTMVYVFSNHHQVDAITYARDMDFFVDGALRLTSVKRGIELNPPLSEAFKGFDDYQPWGETIDSSQLMAKQLAKHVYQAGKGRSLTLFFEQQDHFIALGGADALMDNFSELKKLTNTHKPIKYFVVSHHHRSNLMGLGNVLELGAQLVVSQAHKETVLQSLGTNASGQNLVIVPDRKPFSLGPLTLFDIATSHSEHFLLAYLPSEKMIFAEEHYETNLKAAKPRIYRDMVIFRRALEALDINPETLVDARSWRQISMAEFRRWTDGFTEKTCPEGYAVCADG